MWLTTSLLGLYQLAFANFLGCKTLRIPSITSPGKLQFVLRLDLVTARRTVSLERRIKDLLKNALRMMQNRMIVGNPSVIALLLHLLRQSQNQNQSQEAHHHLLGSLRVRITSDLRRHLNQLLFLHQHLTKSPQPINIEVHHHLLTKFHL